MFAVTCCAVLCRAVVDISVVLGLPVLAVCVGKGLLVRNAMLVVVVVLFVIVVVVVVVVVVVAVVEAEVVGDWWD